MWWVQAITSGFTLKFDATTISLFTRLFALACLVKFSVETKRGYFSYFNPAQFLRIIYQANNPNSFITNGLYKTLYVLKVIAAIGLLFGIAQRVCLAVLLGSFWVEIKIYFKFHTCYFFLLTAALLFDPGENQFFSMPASQNGTDGFSSLLIISTTCAIYFFSSIQKLRSSEFRAGYTLYNALFFIHYENQKKHHLEAVWPKLMSKIFLPENKSQTLKWCAVLSHLTIIIELALPALLLMPGPFKIVGIVAGIFMHAIFTFMLPVTLFHFTLATIATYILFVDPAEFLCYWQKLIGGIHG